MKVGLIGLGRMGLAIAHRLATGKHTIFGYDPNVQNIDLPNFTLTKNVQEVAQQAQIIWLMVPAGKVVDSVINELSPHLQPESILIDGGNSNFKDTQGRYKSLKEKRVSLLDCGTSGGLHGEKIGFSLMIGGEKKALKPQNRFLNLLPLHMVLIILGYQAPDITLKWYTTA